MRKLATVLVLAHGASISACATSPEAGHRTTGKGSIGEAELEGFTWVFDAVEALRPDWLRITNQACIGQHRDVRRASDCQLEHLRNLQTRKTLEVS